MGTSGVSGSLLCETMRTFGPREREPIFRNVRYVTHGPSTVEPLYGWFRCSRLEKHGGRAGYVAGRE
jgi:hypothetical protein